MSAENEIGTDMRFAIEVENRREGEAVAHSRYSDIAAIIAEAIVEYQSGWVVLVRNTETGIVVSRFEMGPVEKREVVKTAYNPTTGKEYA